jgi:hypothetical protein
MTTTRDMNYSVNDRMEDHREGVVVTTNEKMEWIFSLSRHPEAKAGIHLSAYGTESTGR